MSLQKCSLVRGHLHVNGKIHHKQMSPENMSPLVESYTLLNFLFLNILHSARYMVLAESLVLSPIPLIDGETLARGVVRFADD